MAMRVVVFIATVLLIGIARDVKAQAAPSVDGPESSSIDQETYEAMDKAAKALRALAVATEVGMNYRDYGDKLITARASVEQALGDKNLHVPAAFKTGVNESLRIYQDAHALWGWKITVRCNLCYYDPGDQHDNVISPLIRQYPFLSSMIIKSPGGGLLGRGPGQVYYNDAVSQLLNHAQKKVDELYASLPERPTPSLAEQPASSLSAKERLNSLRELLDNGLITPTEYKRKRAEILNGL
jgi:hypothetical protein